MHPGALLDAHAQVRHLCTNLDLAWRCTQWSVYLLDMTNQDTSFHLWLVMSKSNRQATECASPSKVKIGAKISKQYCLHHSLASLSHQKIMNSSKVSDQEEQQA